MAMVKTSQDEDQGGQKPDHKSVRKRVSISLLFILHMVYIDQ